MFELIQADRRSTDGDRDRMEDVDQILQPGACFATPMEVLEDRSLSLTETRAILSSWASDSCAVEAMPALRQVPGAPAPVSFDDIMDALQLLDGEWGSRALGKAAKGSVGQASGGGVYFS